MEHVIFLRKKRNIAPRRGACVCGVAENPATKTFFCCSRGVQHLWHTARNEAIAKGGKGVQTWTPVPASVILKVLLAPWLRRCLCFLFFRVTCSLLEGSREHREQNPVETHQLYSRLISCTRKISTLHLEFKCVCVCVCVCVSFSIFSHCVSSFFSPS